MPISKNLPKKELWRLLVLYDRYIQKAVDTGLLAQGWAPITLTEFYETEYMDLIKSMARKEDQEEEEVIQLT